MFLTATNLFFYLRDTGLCTAQDVVEERFSISETGRRNRNYSVFRGAGRSLFVKQVPMLHPEVTASLRREAACCQLAVGADGRRRGILARTMPQLLHYDPGRHVLIYRFIDDGENLNQHCARTGALTPRVAAVLGETLGRCHAETARPSALLEVAGVFRAEPPWVFAVLRHPEAVMPGMTIGRRGLVEILNGLPDILALLKELHEGWHRLCLMHGDIKGDNVLLTPPTEVPGLHVIDWELADVGDPLWDVASALVSILQPWLVGMPVGGRPADLKQAAGPVGAAARAFWSAYQSATGGFLAHDGTEAFRLARLTAARLVLLGFELLPDGVPASPFLEAVLGLARFCAAEPHKALTQLLGLPATDVASRRSSGTPTLRVPS